jgi:hypothetical protein
MTHILRDEGEKPIDADTEHGNQGRLPAGMHDPAQDASIVLALRARLVPRQMRHDLRPLLFLEPKQICIHGTWLQAG